MIMPAEMLALMEMVMIFVPQLGMVMGMVVAIVAVLVMVMVLGMAVVMVMVLVMKMGRAIAMKMVMVLVVRGWPWLWCSPASGHTRILAGAVSNNLCSLKR